MAQQSNFDAVDWRWEIAGEEGRLYLLLTASIRFATAFKNDALRLPDGASHPFSMADASYYSELRHKFARLPLNEEQQFTLAINATAAHQYLKPLASKSWYFFIARSDAPRPFQVGDYVSTQAKSTGLYLVLDTDTSTSTIFLMSEKQQIDEQRWFHRGTTLRVHNTRLILEPYEIQEHQL